MKLMLSIVPLILLTVSLYILTRKILFHNLVNKKNDYLGLTKEYEELGRQNLKLITDNFDLEKSTQETIALYDITKDICKSLDPDEIFTIFRERINKYIEVEDCKFLKP